MARAVMYSTRLCPYCIRARRLLKRHGIPYEERLMRRRDRADLASLGGGLTYPQLVIGGRVVDGYTELRRLEREGSLTRIMAAE